jgi:hypothetical protein
MSERSDMHLPGVGFVRVSGNLLPKHQIARNGAYRQLHRVQVARGGNGMECALKMGA